MKTPNRPGTPGSALRGSMLSGPMSGRKRSRDCRTLFQDDDTSDPIQVRVWASPHRCTQDAPTVIGSSVRARAWRLLNRLGLLTVGACSASSPRTWEQVMVRVRPPRDTNPDHPDEEVGLCVDTLEEDKLLITAPPP